MYQVANQTGSVPLFTEDGGLDQLRWWSLRARVTGSGVDGSVYLAVNGNSICAFTATNGVDNDNSRNVLLRTGDVVTFELGSATADLVVSGNIFEEDL